MNTRFARMRPIFFKYTALASVLFTEDASVSTLEPLSVDTLSDRITMRSVQLWYAVPRPSHLYDREFYK